MGKEANRVAQILTDVTHVEGTRQGRLVCEADWCDDHWNCRALGPRGGVRSIDVVESLDDVIRLMGAGRATAICVMGDFTGGRS